MTEQLTLPEDPDAAMPVSPLDRFSWDALPETLPIADEHHERFRAPVDNWYLRLCLFRCAGGSRFYPTEAQIAVFTTHLVENQRNDPDLRFGRGSWAVPEDTAMPRDAAVDFAFVPTYIAVAWLVLVEDRYPRLAREVRGFRTALRDGLRFAARTRLRGHGYDASKEMLEAIRYLSLGGVFSHVWEHGERYPAFAAILRELEYSILERLPRETGWSGTSPGERHYALQLIRGGDRDDSLVCPPVWAQWRDTQQAWFLEEVAKAAAPRLTAALLPPVLEEIRERLDELRDCFEAIRPKYSGRRVTSDPMRFRTSVELHDPIDAAVAEAGTVAWLPPMYESQVLEMIKETLGRLAAEELDRRIRGSGVLSNEEFEVIPAPIRVKDNGHSAMSVCVAGGLWRSLPG